MKEKFFTLMFLLGTLKASASLSPLNVNQNNDFKLEIISIVLCLFFILITKRMPFNKIFQSTIIVSMIFFMSTLFNTQETEFGRLLFLHFFPKLFLFLGWAYVNQIYTQKDAINTYFGLAFGAGLIAASLFFAQQLMKYSMSAQSFQKSSMIELAVCLAIAFLCERKISKNLFIENRNSELLLKPAVLLSVLIGGLNILLSLNSQELLKQIGEGSFYKDHAGMQALIMGLGAIIFSILCIFRGPWLVQTRGWLFSVLLIPTSILTTLVMAYFSPGFFTTAAGVLTIRVFGYVLMMPLMQIAFLSYPASSRYATQGVSVLILAPLLENLAALFKPASTQASIASAGIIAAMILAAYLLAQNNPELREENLAVKK